MNDVIHHYIESMLPERPPLFQEMEQYAKEAHVPIMEPVGMDVLAALLAVQKPTKLLEIGTAIGYSALRMATAVPALEIVTLERDEERLLRAHEYMGRMDAGKRITVLAGDALELAEDVQRYGPYDAIFIDAAKGQYKRFFELYAPMLSEGGIIYSDNVLYKGHVAGIEAPSKRLEKVAQKINDYNTWLMGHPAFDTSIIPAGDGIAISRKRSEHAQ